jgi:hypothetical protein
MFTLIVLSPSSLLSISDGDTPEVKMGVRKLRVAEAVGPIQIEVIR